MYARNFIHFFVVLLACNSLLIRPGQHPTRSGCHCVKHKTLFTQVTKIYIKSNRPTRHMACKKVFWPSPRIPFPGTFLAQLVILICNTI
ncbi:hypothetical protein Ppro_0933 [Pelobacter propionicus DSM 2379]|uniref:Lipoprotein n=1 Tax=Pelobacter propionicus (strain DSM 2379 / NBRC 103807 / OttBd1) TaxID=338966 RepID=A1AMJ2_PELPD|nr:hypothetical protein Ppro_0933 [Pelobacter propionicus DSM 2379]